MADSLNSLIKSLGKEARKGSVNPLPPWIKLGAKVTYTSQSSGKCIDAVVQNIFVEKQTVELSLPQGRHALPFSRILGLSNPLAARTAPPAAAEEKEGDEKAFGVDTEKFYADMDKAWVNPNLKEKVQPGPEQGPALKPSWARKMENHRVEDVDSSPERQGRKGAQAIDSSPDPVRPDPVPDPYGLGEAPPPSAASPSKKTRGKTEEKGKAESKPGGAKPSAELDGKKASKRRHKSPSPTSKVANKKSARRKASATRSRSRSQKAGGKRRRDGKTEARREPVRSRSASEKATSKRRDGRAEGKESKGKRRARSSSSSVGRRRAEGEAKKNRRLV